MIENVFFIDHSNRDGGFRGADYPADTIVVFEDANGDKFEIQRHPDLGITVRLVRRAGFDQISVLPRSANEVYIR